MEYICVFVFLFSAINAVNGACNGCLVDTDLACISQTQFQVCVNGTPSGDITNCPNGYVCSTLGTRICQLNETNVLADCADCNVCNPSGSFACTGLQTYALCLNTMKPSSLTGSCAPNHICSIESEQICVNASSGFLATCSQSVNPSVPAPNDDPNIFCSSLAQRGRFPAGTDPETTCHQYVQCLQNNGAWVGALYYCPNNSYFNANTRGCDAQRPARCSNFVRSLSIYGIQLF